MTITAEATLGQAVARRRRKPLYYVVCVGLMCLGAVVSAFAFTRANHVRQVVATSNTIRAGQTISSRDLELVDLNADSRLRTVPADQSSSIVGQVAQLDMAAGSIVTPDSFGATSIPTKGQAVVGLSLTSAQMPATGIAVGDRVSLVAVGGDDNTSTFAQSAATIAGTVVSLSTQNASGSAGGDPATGNTVVDVTVPAADAAGLAIKAANNRVALVLGSRTQ